MIGGFIVFSTCVIIIAVIGVLLLNATKKDHSKFEVKKKEPVQTDSNWSAGEDRWDPFPTRPNMTVVMLDEESCLEEELERALEDEDYLLAAAIRDELKTIKESKNNKRKLQA